LEPHGHLAVDRARSGPREVVRSTDRRADSRPPIHLVEIRYAHGRHVPRTPCLKPGKKPAKTFGFRANPASSPPPEGLKNSSSRDVHNAAILKLRKESK